MAPLRALISGPYRRARFSTISIFAGRPCRDHRRDIVSSESQARSPWRQPRRDYAYRTRFPKYPWQQPRGIAFPFNRIRRRHGGVVNSAGQYFQVEERRRRRSRSSSYGNGSNLLGLSRSPADACGLRKRMNSQPETGPIWRGARAPERIKVGMQGAERSPERGNSRPLARSGTAASTRAPFLLQKWPIISGALPDVTDGAPSKVPKHSEVGLQSAAPPSFASTFLCAQY